MTTDDLFVVKKTNSKGDTLYWVDFQNWSIDITNAEKLNFGTARQTANMFRATEKEDGIIYDYSSLDEELKGG